MEDITDVDYAHAKRVCKDFEIKNLEEYHDLYVQNDTFLLEYLDFICFKIDELDPAKVLLSPGLAWQATLKKTKLTLDLLIDIDMLLMVDKGMRGGIYYSISWYPKANNKCMKDYNKNKDSSYIKYWDANLYGWVTSQKIPINIFQWMIGTSQFMKISLKTIMKKVMKNIFVKLIFNILKNYMNFITLSILTRKNDEKESKGVEKLLANLRDKTEYVIHIRNLNQSLNHG